MKIRCLLCLFVIVSYQILSSSAHQTVLNPKIEGLKERMNENGRTNQKGFEEFGARRILKRFRQGGAGVAGSRRRHSAASQVSPTLVQLFLACSALFNFL